MSLSLTNLMMSARVMGLRVSVNQKHPVPRRAHRLQDKRPQMRHAVLRYLVIRVVQQDVHERFLIQ